MERRGLPSEGMFSSRSSPPSTSLPSSSPLPSPTLIVVIYFIQQPDALDMKNYGFVDITEQLVTKINSKQRSLRYSLPSTQLHSSSSYLSTYLSIYRSLNSVVTLQLDYNSLISVCPEAIFPFSESLRELSLHHNQISVAPDLYSLAPHLTYLDVSLVFF